MIKKRIRRHKKKIASISNVSDISNYKSILPKPSDSGILSNDFSKFFTETSKNSLTPSRRKESSSKNTGNLIEIPEHSGTISSIK